MNISNGMSVIQTNGSDSTSRSARIYLWPAYNPGKITKTAPVSREKQPEFIYRKSDPAEFNRIMSLMQHDSAIGYTETGKTSLVKTVIEPGSLFDAIV